MNTDRPEQPLPDSDAANEDDSRPASEELPHDEEGDDLAWLRRLGKERDQQREARRRTEAMTVRFTRQAARRLREQATSLEISVPRYVEILCTYRDPSIAARAQDLLSEIHAAADELEEALSKKATPESSSPGSASYEQVRERVAALRRRARGLVDLYIESREAGSTD